MGRSNYLLLVFNMYILIHCQITSVKLIALVKSYKSNGHFNQIFSAVPRTSKRLLFHLITFYLTVFYINVAHIVFQSDIIIWSTALMNPALIIPKAKFHSLNCIYVANILYSLIEIFVANIWLTNWYLGGQCFTY